MYLPLRLGQTSHFVVSFGLSHVFLHKFVSYDLVIKFVYVCLYGEILVLHTILQNPKLFPFIKFVVNLLKLHISS